MMKTGIRAALLVSVLSFSSEAFSDPLLGEIRWFAGNFAPKGYEFCDGQQLPIRENMELYRVLGVTYGGDGVTTFALPDMKNSTPAYRIGNGSTMGMEKVVESSPPQPATKSALISSSSIRAVGLSCIIVVEGESPIRK